MFAVVLHASLSHERKNGCSGVNRVNGVMLPGNTSAFTER